MPRVSKHVVVAVLTLMIGSPLFAQSGGDNQPTEAELRKAVAAARDPFNVNRPDNPNHPSIDKLRKEYAQARDAFGKIDEGDFDAWGEAYGRLHEASQMFAFTLLRASWKSSSEGEFPKLSKELLPLHQEMTGHPNQSSLDHLSFYAETIFPYLLQQNVRADQASLFVKLTTPDQLVRVNDKAAQLDTQTEPHNWIVQDAHALALMRAGKFEDARKESDLLLKKVTVNLSKGNRLAVEAGVNYRDVVRSAKSLRREYLLHRALIEAVAGELEAAKAKLVEAMAVKEDDSIKRRQNRVVQEIQLLIEG
ncbi:MAG: hypothetical protein AB8B50_04975 [Pirellulaceae bacterium]